ncbi:MAG TPA: hypothetical protein VFU53_04160 [Burkholderiales bacterium]|nr:hypothetical protein [Burkholderiales bacterium]
MPCVQRARAILIGASSLVAALCILPTPVHSGEILDTLSPEARRTADMLVRQAVVHDHCPGRTELDDEAADFYIDLLSRALGEQPQYRTLDADSHKVALLNLLHEMQEAADAAPAPDCSKGYDARRT